MPSDEYYDFFLKSAADIVKFVTFEIYHADFDPDSFYIVQNNVNGLTATLETAAEVDFEFYPARISQNETSDDLDFGIKFDFGDVGDLLPDQFDKVAIADGFGTKPLLKYREYRSDDLTEPMLGPLTLEITEFSFSKTGATFEAKAPSLNLNRTGEFYTIERFPMLRDLL